MKKSDYYYILFFVIMIGGVVPMVIDEIDSNLSLGIFISSMILYCIVIGLGIKEENKERKIKHDNECKCTCGMCCRKLKLEKKKKHWWKKIQ